MVTRSDVIGSELLFTDAIAAMDAAEGYLGSADFLSGLLRLLVSDWTELLGSGTATPDLAKKLADEYAAILFGEKEGYGRLPGWNEAGGIDVFVASELGIPDTGRDAIENALVQLLMRATAIANYADEPDVLDEHWRWQVDAMFEEFANLFLGIPGEDPDGPEFGPDVPSEPLTEGWITINAGDDDEGGQRVYIDGSGVMQTGHFKGQTMDQAFGKGKAKAKPDADQSSPPVEPAKPATPDPKPEPPHINAKDDKELSAQLKKFVSAGFRVANDNQGKYFLHDPNTNEVKGTISIDPAAKPKPYKPPKAKPTPAGPAYAKKPEAKPDKSAPDPTPAEPTAGDGAPKLAKPAAFGSMMGGPAKSVNTSLNDMPDSIDAGGVGLMFDIVGANEHDELAKAIKTVRPDMASAVDAEIADRKASAEKWAKAKAENDDLMSVHPSLAKPGDLNKTKVKAAFKDVAPEQHDKLIKAISAARPDLADHAAASKPKAKAAKVAKPALVQKKHTTKFEDAAVQKQFAKQFPNSTPGQLVGAPDGAKVTVTGKVSIIAPGEYSDELYEGTEISVEHPGVKKMKRVIYQDHNGTLTIRNESLETTQPGVGREILRDQIREARKTGVKQITTFAAKMGADGKKFNGYYTWARYGYDADLTALPGGGKAVRKEFPNAKTVSDVMATEQGRKWWKENGSSFNGTFDLDPKSRSMKIFNGYLAAKGEDSV
jgi:hypothetical protein